MGSLDRLREILKSGTAGAVNQAAVLASRSTPRWLLRRVAGLFGRQTGQF